MATRRTALFHLQCSLVSSTLTLFDAEAGGPLLQGDVFIIVGVAGLEEAGGAMLHGDEGGTQGGELGVGQVPGDAENVKANPVSALPSRT